MADNKTARLVIDGQQAKTTLKDLQKDASRVRNILRNLDPELDREKVAKYKAEYEKVNTTINGTKQQLGLMRQESVQAVNVFKQFNPIQGQIDALGGKFGMVKGGVGTLIRSLGGLKIAFAATGIGAVVIALGALFMWLTKTQKGMDLIERVTGMVSAAFNVFTDRVLMAGEGLSDFFTGDFTGGFDKLKASVSGVTDELIAETSATYGLIEAQQQLRDDTNDFIVTQARRRNEIAKLILLTRDETVSFEDKADALQKANQIETQTLNDQIELQKRRIAGLLQVEKISERELELLKQKGVTLEQVGFANSEEVDRAVVLEEIAKLIDLETNSVNRQRELKNRMIELENKRLAAVKAQNAALLAQQEIEAEKAAFEQTRQQTQGLEALDPAEAPEIVQQNAIGELALENLKTLEEQKAVIEEESKKRRLEADEAFFQSRDALLDQSLASGQDFLEATIGLLGKETSARRAFGAALKGLKIAEIAISLQREIQAIWEIANSSPSNLLFPGYAQLVAGVKTGAAIGRAAVATATVAKTKFAEGGELMGPSHAAGGIPFTIGGVPGFEAEGGEFLMSKAATQMYKPLLEGLNRSVKFAEGGQIPVMQPQFTTPANVPVDTTMNDMLVQELRALRQDFNTLERERKTVLVYSDLESFNNEVAEIRNY